MTPSEFISALRDYLYDGGLVIMAPLAVSTLVLWYTLGYRFLTLQRGTRQDARRLIDGYLAGSQRPVKGIVDRGAALGALIGQTRRPDLRNLLDDGFAELEREMDTGRILVRSLVGVAPLLGLLGTVTGMIETFESLSDMSLFSQSGGIAGGIAQALFTTQMGLSVAVPGVVVGKLLETRQQNLSQELAILKDIICHRFMPQQDTQTV